MARLHYTPVLLLGLLACQHRGSATNGPSDPAAPSASAAQASTQSPAPQPRRVHEWTTGLAQPESMLWDEAGDRYLVSNIDGVPSEADGKGYIATLAPDSDEPPVPFIVSGKPGPDGKPVTLDAPKGMALVGELLYVADLTRVRRFELKTGNARGAIDVPGATFLNDVAAAPDGRVFVSDTGVRATPSGMEGTGTDAIWEVSGERPVALLRGPELQRPNGLLWTPQGLLVVPLGGKTVMRLSADGKLSTLATLPTGSLDGIVAVGEDWLISSWEGKCVYRGSVERPFTVLLANQTSPADLGWDARRKRLLVPHLAENRVEAWQMP